MHTFQKQCSADSIVFFRKSCRKSIFQRSRVRICFWFAEIAFNMYECLLFHILQDNGMLCCDCVWNRNLFNNYGFIMTIISHLIGFLCMRLYRNHIISLIILYLLLMWIQVPPTLRAVPQNGEVSARKGSTVTLECKASGNPVPSIYWFKKVGFHSFCRQVHSVHRIYSYYFVYVYT